MDDMKVGTVGDDHISSGGTRDLGSSQFGCHSTGSYVASGTSLSHGQQMLIQFFYHIDESCFWIFMGIIGKQPVNI